MRHKTISQYEAAVRQHCRECQGDKKLVSTHCDSTGCIWFDDRAALIERTLTLSLFTFAGFKAHCRLYLINEYDNMLSSMWWSDIRLMVAEHLREIRAAQPKPCWWGAIAAEVMPAVGWMTNGETRTSPINRASENKYIKRIWSSIPRETVA